MIQMLAQIEIWYQFNILVIVVIIYSFRCFQVIQLGVHLFKTVDNNIERMERKKSYINEDWIYSYRIDILWINFRFDIDIFFNALEIHFFHMVCFYWIVID